MAIKTGPVVPPLIQTGCVIDRRSLCTDHFRLTIELPSFRDAQPGMFVHIGPERLEPTAHAPHGAIEESGWSSSPLNPLLRRAYSIAALQRSGGNAAIDIIFRVVGTGTRWMAGLGKGDRISVLGPLGNAFPVHDDRRHAWLVAGGVGLPPLLWFSAALAEAGRDVVAFVGAQRRELLALTLKPGATPDTTACEARPVAEEFASHRVPVVISTDDGSLGFRGFVPRAMVEFDEHAEIDPADVVVYTCGPERMMRAVADHCRERGMACYVCLERAMACGLGTCQSCVVRVNDPTDADGWRYLLCCTEGPVLNAAAVVWD